jgi:hypothetical protein
MNGNWGLIIFGAFFLVSGLVGIDLPDFREDVAVTPGPQQYQRLSPRMRIVFKILGVVLIVVGCVRLIYPRI